MSKSVKIIYGVIIAGIVFGGGYFVGAKNSAEVMKEVRIGYQHDNDPNRVDYHKIYTDLENPTIIDGFLMIYINREKVEDMDLNLKHPDLYIELNNPKNWVGLKDSKIWFQEDGAIMGESVGESGDQMVFYRIDDGDANFIKEAIGYEEE